MQQIIQEVIRKECEAYRLVEFGLLASVGEGVERLLPLADLVAGSPFESPTGFQRWREELLWHFYRQVDYAGFIKREAEGRSFRRFLFFRRQKIIARLREAYKGETIDCDLAVPPHTLAFKLSTMLDDELYELEQSQIQLVGIPSDLDIVCTSSCHRFFPIELPVLLTRLKKADAGFWDTLYLTVKKLTDIVTNKQFVPLLYRKEVVQDAWSDTSLFLHEKITQGEVPVFENSQHFRHYIARVCLNKLREAIRKNNCQEVMSDIPDCFSDRESLFDDEDDKIDISLQTGSLHDIDTDNQEEIGRALTIILWDKLEPWYSLITEGVDDKIELLFRHYVRGLSYESIAAMQGEGLTDTELRRLEAKLRQDAVRTRRLLKQRFMDLLKKNKRI